MYSLYLKSLFACMDEIETSFCLPIILIIILCTCQFIYNHFFNVGSTIYQVIKDRPKQVEGLLRGIIKTEQNSFINTIKEMIFGKIKQENIDLKGNDASLTSIANQLNIEANDWDYYHEDY